MRRTQSADYISAHCIRVCSVHVCVPDCVEVQMQHNVASHVEHCMDSTVQKHVAVRMLCSKRGALSTQINTISIVNVKQFPFSSLS